MHYVPQKKLPKKEKKNKNWSSETPLLLPTPERQIDKWSLINGEGVSPATALSTVTGPRIRNYD